MKCLVLVMALAAACSNNNSSGSSNPDGGSGTPPDGSGTPPDGSGPPTTGTFTGFVVDLVTHQTADNTAPVAYARFASLPDSDGDSNNTTAYASLF